MYLQQLLLPGLESNHFHGKQYFGALRDVLLDIEPEYLVRRYVTLDY